MQAVAFPFIIWEMRKSLVIKHSVASEPGLHCRQRPFYGTLGIWDGNENNCGDTTN